MNSSWMLVDLLGNSSALDQLDSLLLGNVVLQLIFRSRSLTKGDELFERWTSKFREDGLGTLDGEGTDGVSGAGKDFS